jgi:hypothetical protein
MRAADGKQGQRMTSDTLQNGSSAFSSDWLTAKEAVISKAQSSDCTPMGQAGQNSGDPLSGSVRRTWRFSKRELDAMLYESV